MYVDEIFDAGLYLDLATATESEFQAMMRRSAAIDRFQSGILASTLSTGDIIEFGDLLAEDGIDPYEYWDCVTDNIRYCIDNNIPLETWGG